MAGARTRRAGQTRDMSESWIGETHERQSRCSPPGIATRPRRFPMPVRLGPMPEIDFAFLADAAETQPGHKFHVLGGGITRIGGRTFPLRHPHLALVVGLLVTAPETDREHELRIVLLDPDGHEVTGATGSLVAQGHPDGRDAILTFSIDLWNLTFPSPGDYSFRILVNGSERKRLPLVLVRPTDAAPGGRAGAT
jgi:hypothetical protein